MIVDGRAIAHELLRETAERSKHTAPSFAALTIAPSPATESYLRIKARQASAAGLSMDVIRLPQEATTEEIIATIAADAHDALIVQLPLPSSVDLHAVLNAIPIEKDADVLSTRARSEQWVMHPVAHAVKRILTDAGTVVDGARAVVIGKGWLVGEPVAAWLMGAGADVTVVTRESGDLIEACRNATIIVSGAGVPSLVTPDMVPAGAAVIDVGTSELGGSLMGDVAPEVASGASVFTPVPGGVGPVAVAYLLQNVVTLAEKRQLHDAHEAV